MNERQIDALTLSCDAHAMDLDDEAIADLIVGTREPRPDVLASIERRIRAFEQGHTMSSGMMRAMVESGSVAPTREVETWLMALHVRDELLSKGTR